MVDGIAWNCHIDHIGMGFFCVSQPNLGRFPRFPKTLTLSSLPVPSRKAVPSSLATLVALGEAVAEKCIARGEVFSTPALAKRNRPRGTPSDV